MSILRKNKILHLKQINSYWRDYIMMSTPAGFDCLRLILLRYYLISMKKCHKIILTMNLLTMWESWVWSLMLYEEPIYAPQEQEKEAWSGLLLILTISCLIKNYRLAFTEYRDKISLISNFSNVNISGNSYCIALTVSLFINN